MTRMFRAIPLSSTRLSLLSAIASIALVASAGTASAGIDRLINSANQSVAAIFRSSPVAPIDQIIPMNAPLAR